VVASPAAVAREAAGRGELVTAFGYGCTNRETLAGGFIKRSRSYAYGRSESLCPGDSGGPVLRENGDVFLVNSGYYVRSGDDIFGEPWRLLGDIAAQQDAWDANSDTLEEPAEVNVTNATGAGLWVRCDGALSMECSDWTHIRDGATARIYSHARRLILDNQDYHPQVRWSWHRVVAPSFSPTVYANQAHPFQAVGAPEDDGDPCVDANDSMEDADGLDGAMAGRICAGDVDWYRVDRLGAWSVTLRFTHDDGDIDVRVYDADGRQTGQSASTGDREDVAGEGAGFVEVYGYNGAENSYIISVD
jgi:hypothetical protein